MLVRELVVHMLNGWYDDARIDRETWKRRSTIAMSAESEFGNEADDNAQWQGRIAAWLKPHLAK